MASKRVTLVFVVMLENPYASSSELPEARNQTQPFRKMLWLGVLITLLSFLFFCFLVSRLFLTNSQLGEEVSASGLANRVSGAIALIPVAFLSGLGGLAFAIVGGLRSGKRVR